MSKFAATKTNKGKLHCNSCQKATSPKDGDWFESPKSAGQQIFLCKVCEPKYKNTHKRANASRV